MPGINGDDLARIVCLPRRPRGNYATYPSVVIIVSSTNCHSVAGSSTHKNDATGNGRPAPLLAEPRYGAAPQPYGEYLSVYLSVCPIRPFRLFAVPNGQIKPTGSENRWPGRSQVFSRTRVKNERGLMEDRRRPEHRYREEKIYRAHLFAGARGCLGFSHAGNSHVRKLSRELFTKCSMREERF